MFNFNTKGTFQLFEELDIAVFEKAVEQESNAGVTFWHSLEVKDSRTYLNAVAVSEYKKYDGGDWYYIPKAKRLKIALSTKVLELLDADVKNDKLRLKIDGVVKTLDYRSRDTVAWTDFGVNCVNGQHKDIIMLFFSTIGRKLQKVDLSDDASGWANGEHRLAVTHKEYEADTSALRELLTSLETEEESVKRAGVLSLAVSVASLIASKTHSLSNHNLMALVWSPQGGLGKTTLTETIAQAFSDATSLSGATTKAALLRTFDAHFDSLVYIDELSRFFANNNQLAMMHDMQALINGISSARAVGSNDVMDRFVRSHILASANLSLKERTATLAGSGAFAQRILEVRLEERINERTFNALQAIAATTSKGELGAWLSTQISTDKMIDEMIEVRKLMMSDSYFDNNARYITTFTILTTCFYKLLELTNIKSEVLVSALVAVIEDTYKTTATDSTSAVINAGMQLLLTSKIETQEDKESVVNLEETIGFRRHNFIYLLGSAAEATFKRAGLDFISFIHAVDAVNALKKDASKKQIKVTVNGTRIRLYCLNLVMLNRFMDSDAGYSDEESEIPF